MMRCFLAVKIYFRIIIESQRKSMATVEKANRGGYSKAPSPQQKLRPQTKEKKGGKQKNRDS